MSEALKEAIEAKRRIENILKEELEKFSHQTGLRVTGACIIPINTTNLSDEYPKFGVYSVQLEIDIP